MAQVSDVSNAKTVNQAQFGDPGTTKGTDPQQAAETAPPEQPQPAETARVESGRGREIDVTA